MRNALISAITLAMLAVQAGAQDAFRTGSGTFTVVAQDDRRADRIRRVLEGIRLPDGFRISLYALVPDARHMAVAGEGGVTFVGTRRSEVWSVTDRDGDGVAEDVRNFAPGLRKRMPNGPCMDADGSLYIVEQNRVLRFPDAATTYAQAQVMAVPVVPQDRLIPVAEESRGHSARVCDFGPDGKLYISLGQPHNVSPRHKLALYDETGIGGIIRMDPDGTNREVYTRGVRNSVGHDHHPVTGELWFTDNQVDGMGDDIPPGELNRQTQAGQHFGFPWYGGGTVRTGQYAGDTVPDGMVPPVVEMIAHAADLGMRFYTGDMFPARYRHAIISAQHGSWNRSTPVGARVMVTFPGDDGTARSEPFAEGWIAADGGYLGRPVDVAQLPDGSLLVSDDHADAIYRISYGE